MYIFPDLDQSVVKELQGTGRFESEHLLQAHTLLHTHVNRVDTHEPDHLLLAGWDCVGTDLECVVPVVRVIPEPALAFLHKECVVEGLVSDKCSKLSPFGCEVQVVDPFVPVADLE